MPRPGFITASMFNSVMTKDVGKVVMKQCCRIACERLGVVGLEEQFDISGMRAIEWGLENESLAVAAYEAETFSTVHSSQVFHRIPELMVGGTPDGLVGDDGGVEIKCPNSDNHLLTVTQSSQLDDYVYQPQAYMWIFERKWWDFISFDPRFPDDLQLFVRRIERNETTIARMAARAAEMEKVITELLTVVYARRGVAVPDVFDLDLEPPVRRPRTNGAVSATLYDPKLGEVRL